MKDRDSYDRYQSRFMDVFKRFRGRLLAADEHPSVVEGKFKCDKAVLMEFPDEGAFREFSESPEYQEISKDRKAGADAIVLMISGLSS